MSLHDPPLAVAALPPAHNHQSTRVAPVVTDDADDLRQLLGSELLRSPWVGRLARISFLGTLDFQPDRGRSFSRLEHSFGVARLGHRVARDLCLAEGDLRAFVAACLLHDVGHPPLSHSAEPAFAALLGADHHRLAEWILHGRGSIGYQRSLGPVLERSGLDVARVWALMTGEPIGSAADGLLTLAINVDTLDGIVRAGATFGVDGPDLSGHLLALNNGRPCISATAVPMMDAFWRLKDHVYTNVINRPSNVLLEASLAAVVTREVACRTLPLLEDLDDDWLMGVLGDRWDAPGIVATADAHYVLSAHAPEAPELTRALKHYEVDASIVVHDGGLPIEHWSRRYRHRREIAYLVRRQEPPRGALAAGA